MSLFRLRAKWNAVSLRPFQFKLFVILFLFHIVPAGADSGALSSALAYDPQWLNLLRYERVGFFTRGFESQVINSEFFLSPQGMTDPVAEWNANLQAARTDRQYACHFPARRLYFEKHRLLGSLPLSAHPGDCPDYDFFKTKLNAEKVSIVFAAFYIDNPGSAFGHTLFKIQGRGERNTLLAHGSSFAANLTTLNPVLYAWKGFTGGFTGSFSMMPYYLKILEYNQSEHRDLWEYPLNLNPEQVEFFVAHLWEMDRAKFRYYYLTKNCSYHLLKHLDAVNPEWGLAQRMNSIVIPTQTIRALLEVPGLVGVPQFRPSQFTRLDSRYKTLSPTVKRRLSASLTGLGSLTRDKLPELNDEQWRELLDFSIEYLDFHYGRELLLDNVSSPAIEAKNHILTLRSEAPASRLSSTEVTKPAENSPAIPPEEGHPERRWSLGVYSQGSDYGPTLEYRFSFHDWMDRDEGRPRWSTLVMGDFQFEYDLHQGQPGLDKISLARAASNPEVLDPLGSFSGLSWAWDFGIENPPVLERRLVAGFVQAGLGATWLNTQRFLLSSMVYATERYSPAFEGAAWWSEVAPTLNAGVLLPLGNWGSKIGAQAARHYSFSRAMGTYNSLNLTSSWFLGARVSVRMSYIFQPQNGRFQAGLSYDF